MALQTTTNINIDFCDKKYILVNSKQLDKKSRFLSVTCYNNGELFNLYSSEHSAYVRYRKPDGYGVFNFCEINNKGKIIIELTEQMLAVDGISYADLVIVNKGEADIDIETGEIVTIDNASILSTMTFCIDVSEMAVSNSEIESSYEYDGLNDLLERAEATYQKVVLASQAHAEQSEHYYQMSADQASSSAASAQASAISAEDANDYRREAEYYCELTKTIVNGLNSGFIPMGTIYFAELATAEKATGFTYNINDDFVTDNTFREGSGKSYTAGTNVYYTADGYWDCFGGAATPIATVDEVKSYLSI